MRRAEAVGSYKYTVDNFNEKFLNEYEAVGIQYKKVLKKYEKYIENMEEVQNIFNKITTLQYIDCGLVDWEEWKHNKHIFIINGKEFEYRTGTGIKNESVIESLLNAIYCFLSDAYCALNYTEEEFLVELGYDNGAKSFYEGQQAYRECLSSVKKCTEIWGRSTIENIYEIMSL